MWSHYPTESSKCSAKATLVPFSHEHDSLRASATRTSTLMVLGVMFSGILTGCGEEEAYHQIGIESAQQRSGLDTDYATAIFYENVDFKVYYQTRPAYQGHDSFIEFKYPRGTIESVVVYPGCWVKFTGTKIAGEWEYNGDHNPYYIHRLNSKRKDWDIVQGGCDEGYGYGTPLPHNAMVWSDTNWAGQRLPLFVGQDWLYPGWFRNQVSSVEVASGHYLVAYIGDDPRMATTIIARTNLNIPDFNIDNQITKTEVHAYDRHEGEVGCSTPRGCYEGATCNTEPHTIEEEHAGLATCHALDGFTSYCTGQYRCVDAQTGAPKVVSHDEGK